MKPLPWLAALILALAAPPALARPDAEQQIIDHGKRWSALYEAGQIDDMRALYEPDAWLMTHGAPALKGVDAILAYLRRNKQSGNHVQFSVAPELITIDGNRAFLISRYWMIIDTPAKAHIEAAGRSMLVYKRGKDGVWRIWRDMDNQPSDVSPADRPQ